MPRAPRSKAQTSKPELEVISSDTILMPAPAPTTPTADQENAPAPVGEQLRRERERRGITIEAVAHMLKIRRVYLRAIEESNWAELPEPVYVNGFIRSYANFLGLNVLHSIQSAKSEIINLPALPKLEIPKPIDDQQLPSVTTIILAALGLFFLYAVWIAVHSDSEKPDAMPTVTNEQTAADTPVAAATPTPTLLNEPALVQSNDDTRAPTPQSEAASPAAKPAASLAPQNTVFGATSPTRATITATQDSWLQIQAADRHVVFTGVLRSGDSYRVPDMIGLTLKTTNLTGLKFQLDGTAVVPPLNTGDAIDQSLSLSPNNFLKLTKAAPDTASTLSASAYSHTAVMPRAHTTAASPAPAEMEDSTSDQEYPDESQ